MLIVALPTLVRVMAIGLLERPTFIPLKVAEVGLKLAAGAWPVPVRGMLSGLLEALVVKVRLAVRDPIAEGVKVIPIIQFNPAPREPPQGLLEIE